MLSEGVGSVAPVRIIIRVGLAEAEALFQGLAFLDRYEFRQDSWGRSVLNPEDPADAQRMGILGEYAASSWLRKQTNLPLYPNTERLEIADPGYDLKVGNRRIQIKTRCSKAMARNHKSLVKTDQVSGWDLAVFVQVMLSPEPPDSLFPVDPARYWRVGLLGWLTVEEVKRMPTEGGLGPWTNYRISDRSLRHMRSIISELSDEL